MLFPIFLLIFFLGSTVRALLPLPACSPAPSVTFRAGNDVTRVGGATAIIFGPLQCSHCYNFMRRLNDICNQRNYRIFVVAPDFESNHIILRTSSAFPNIQIDRAGEGWPRLGASNFDAMILDSCGRVTEVLGWPQTDVTTSSALLSALDAANSKCGQCSAPVSGSSNSNRKKINAYIKEREREQWSREAGRSRAPQKELPANYQQTTYQNPSRNQNQNSYQQNQYKPSTPQQHHQQQQQQQQAPQFNNYPPQNAQNPLLNTQYQYNQNQYVQSANYNFYTPPPPPPPPIPTKPLAKSTTTTEAVDYDYYPSEDDTAVPTTQSTQTQIPRPPIGVPNWPTFSPFLQNPYHQMQYQPNNGHLLPAQFQPNPVMENNLPCSAFTDDICFQQRERMGSQMSKCCNKGIYLTDVCVPGKCSNSTTQLCCFQKFLQAKYSCCDDPIQDEGAPKMTNMFNKCCYNMFVTEDPCCPELAARRYWSTAYEVCMPTVTVDFSPVRFEVHFTEGVRVLDLGTDRQWDFNCTYGKKRPQYAYLP